MLILVSFLSFLGVIGRKQKRKNEKKILRVVIRFDNLTNSISSQNEQQRRMRTCLLWLGLCAMLICAASSRSIRSDEDVQQLALLARLQSIWDEETDLSGNNDDDNDQDESYLESRKKRQYDDERQEDVLDDQDDNPDSNYDSRPVQNDEDEIDRVAEKQMENANVEENQSNDAVDSQSGESLANENPVTINRIENDDQSDVDGPEQTDNQLEEEENDDEDSDEFV
jgi:hypothetical protein